MSNRAIIENECKTYEDGSQQGLCNDKKVDTNYSEELEV